ncbi:MAG: tetratricopeptide repeat protein [Spirochaetales bacterium]
MPLLLILSIILGVLVVLFTVIIVRSILTPRRVASLADQYKKGNYSSVIKGARRLIAKEPRNPDAHYFTGLAYQAQGKDELALMEYKTVNSIGDFTGEVSEPQFRRRIAELYEKFNQPEEALKEYLLLMKSEPTNAEYPFRAGRLFEDRHKTEQATGYFRKAIELDPRHGPSFFRLGRILYRTKRPAEAKKMLQQSVKFDPDNAQAHYYLGKILKDNREYNPALQSFEKAQRDSEYKVKSIIERGGCYMNQGNFDRAVGDLERAVKLIQDESSNEALYAHYFLGISYEKLRDIESAVSEWEKVYSRNPKFKDVSEKLSEFQSLRADDRIKDYMTANDEKFYEICRSVASASELTVRSVTPIDDGCDVIGVESQSKWRNARPMPKLLRFLRITDVLDEGSVRAVHEEMRRQNITRAVIVTSSAVSSLAKEFAETRPIDIYDREKLHKMLDKVPMSHAQR